MCLWLVKQAWGSVWISLEQEIQFSALPPRLAGLFFCLLTSHLFATCVFLGATIGTFVLHVNQWNLWIDFCFCTNIQLVLRLQVLKWNRVSKSCVTSSFYKSWTIYYLIRCINRDGRFNQWIHWNCVWQCNYNLQKRCVQILLLFILLLLFAANRPLNWLMLKCVLPFTIFFLKGWSCITCSFFVFCGISFQRTSRSDDWSIGMLPYGRKYHDVISSLDDHS